MKRVSLLLTFLVATTSCMVPNSRDQEARLQKQALSVSEVRDEVDYVKYEQGNVSSEIRMFESRLVTQEEVIQTTRRELADAQLRDREQLSRALTDFEERVAKMESKHHSMIEDLRELKTHANDVASSLGQAKQRMGTLERSYEGQTETIRNLEGAVRALMALVEASDGAPPSTFAKGAKIYKVQSGDTLEKIARREGSTVRAIKRANDLKKDLIRVGQTLKIPK